MLKKASNAPEDPSKVIIIGSIAGIYEGDILSNWSNTFMAYNVSKTAVHSLAKNLAVYLTPSGVINVIAPGVVPVRSDQQKAVEGCLGNETDIAGTALYLASHAGAWVSGSIIKIDGETLLHGKELGKEYSIISDKPKDHV